MPGFILQHVQFLVSANAANQLRTSGHVTLNHWLKVKLSIGMWWWGQCSTRNRKYPVGSSCVEENALMLTSGVRGRKGLVARNK